MNDSQPTSVRGVFPMGGRIFAVMLATLSGVLVFVAVATSVRPTRVVAAADDLPPHEVDHSSFCEDGEQASGAKYRICLPTSPPWNGDLVIYAHGYVSSGAPVAIPEDQLVVGGISIPEVLNSLGYAFATTSYSTNGLAVREGIADLVDLIHVFTTTRELTPTRIYLSGASEGGIITTLAVERYPDVFDGGLAACGPVDGLSKQIDHFGDFRIVFDYFFPGLMPGEPVTIPQWLIDSWDSYYATVVSPTITSPSSAYSLTQLFSVTGAPHDPANPATMITTTRGLLWYNVFATNDSKAKLGGQPFDNTTRSYTGSDDDALLNQMVRRFTADQAALDEIQAHYQTTGGLAVPLVTIHTTLDEIVPYQHETLYLAKVAANHRMPWHENIPVERYGHCNFEASEVLDAFVLLVDKVTNQDPDLSASRKMVVDASGDGVAGAGEVLTYTITITNRGTIGAGIVLTDVLTTGLTYVPDSLAYGFPGLGFVATFSGNVLLAHTSGYLSPPEGGSLYIPNVATITFTARVSDPLPADTYLVNAIELRDQTKSYLIPPAIIRIGYEIHLPVVFRSHGSGQEISHSGRNNR
jgi:uncharacterized repeat protein (TIGR01451 family)